MKQAEKRAFKKMQRQHRKELVKLARKPVSGTGAFSTSMS